MRLLPPVRPSILAITALISCLLILFVLRIAFASLPADDGVMMFGGKPIGGDFIAFYTGGRVFDEHRGRLYDLEFQQDFRDTALLPVDVDPIGALPFVYPPLVGSLMAPISRLPFQTAFFVWMGIGLVSSLASLLLLMRASGASQVIPVPILVLIVLGFPPFLGDVFLGGQAAWIGIVVLSLTSAALIRQKDFAAGLAMSLSYYKPPLFLLMLLVLVIARGRRFVLGFAAGAAVLVVCSTIVVGVEGMQSYLAAVSRYTYGQEFQAGSSLDPRWAMGLVGLGVSLLSSPWLTLAVLAIPFAYFARLGALLLASDERHLNNFGLILTTTATIGFSLQVLHYDLALLLVPLIVAIGHFGALGQRASLFLALAPSGFYFEFLFRKEELAGATVNGASFVFVAVLGWLAWGGQRTLTKSRLRATTNNESSRSTQQDSMFDPAREPPH
jgi:hypothetical protein